MITAQMSNFGNVRVSLCQELIISLASLYCIHIIYVVNVRQEALPTPPPPDLCHVILTINFPKQTLLSDNYTLASHG
jgi:hypothetical protein